MVWKRKAERLRPECLHLLLNFTWELLYFASSWVRMGGEDSEGVGMVRKEDRCLLRD